MLAGVVLLKRIVLARSLHPKLILIETEFQQAIFLETLDSEGFIPTKVAKNQ